jgi:hypothetical protein
MHERRLNWWWLMLRAAQLALAAAAYGCAGVDLTPPTPPVPPRPGPVVTVSARELSWTTDSVVRFSITNPDAVPIYWTCPRDGLQYYRDGWRALDLGYFCLNEYPWFVALAPGDSIVGSYRLTMNYFPQSGWYRFWFWLYRTPSSDGLWREVSRVSPPFYVGP